MLEKSQRYSMTGPETGEMHAAPPWYALQVKARHERATAVHLSARSMEIYAPVYVTKERWSDRIKQLERPLFPGYVFCRFRTDQRLAVLTTPGVMSIVGFGTVPAPVSEDELQAVRAIARSGLPYSPWPYVRVGDGVRIEGGCMQGMRGTLVRTRDQFRVVVNIELLQRSVAVEIDRELVRAETSALRTTA